ncbi:MAG: regulatory protein RecX [Chloroflexi bacterium]|nr:regulatory protein RecX [Chloroflexota bacterium]
MNIEIDGSYAFSLQLALIAGLKVGQELSEEQVAKLQAADVVEKAYERSLNYLSYRPRSADELRQYLLRHSVEEQAIGQVLERLRRARLIDDGAFAQYWVENREAFRPRGHWLLSGELRQKGVGREAIEAALADVDEAASARRAAESAMRRYAGRDREGFIKGMMGFLQRRGFPYGLAREATERCWEAIQPDSESAS